MEARQTADKYVATIYLQMLSPTQVGWYLQKPDGSAPVEIHLIVALNGAPKINSWVRNIVEDLKWWAQTMRFILIQAPR